MIACSPSLKQRNVWQSSSGVLQSVQQFTFPLAKGRVAKLLWSIMQSAPTVHLPSNKGTGPKALLEYCSLSQQLAFPVAKLKAPPQHCRLFQHFTFPFIIAKRQSIAVCPNSSPSSFPLAKGWLGKLLQSIAICPYTSPSH